MKTYQLAAVCAAILISSAAAQSPASSAPGSAAGTGLFVAPSSAAYADLTNAADQMFADFKRTFPAASTVILYDQPTFSAIPYYQSAVYQVDQVFRAICKAEQPAAGGEQKAFSLTLDPGSAASGLAALIALTVPSYSIQGQAVSIDNTALISAFAQAAKTAGLNVINPVYLLPAAPQKGRPPLKCGDTTTSFAQLWAATTDEATKAQKLPTADKSPLKDALAAYAKVRDTLLASDKGPPLLGKLLMVEALANLVTDPQSVAVVDMRLDGVGIDSTTRTVLWWRTTRFSSNVLAHYYLLSVQGSGKDFSLALAKAGSVNIMTKDVNQKYFASCSAPAGQINGQSVTPHGHCAPAKRDQERQMPVSQASGQ
jgi:hypothetical protein